MQYIQWAGAEGHDPFFTDPDVKKLFKNHIDTMVNRRNTINNRLYKDDPTIFAWDLMNEPRCDCFPDFIPVPDSYVSCRPECAKKVQVGLSFCLHGLSSWAAVLMQRAKRDCGEGGGVLFAWLDLWAAPLSYSLCSLSLGYCTEVPFLEVYHGCHSACVFCVMGQNVLGGCVDALT